MRNIYTYEVLQQWLSTLLKRGDVCSQYKISCILDVINLISKESAL